MRYAGWSNLDVGREKHLSVSHLSERYMESTYDSARSTESLCWEVGSEF